MVFLKFLELSSFPKTNIRKCSTIGFHQFPMNCFQSNRYADIAQTMAARNAPIVLLPIHFLNFLPTLQLLLSPPLVGCENHQQTINAHRFAISNRRFSWRAAETQFHIENVSSMDDRFRVGENRENRAQSICRKVFYMISSPRCIYWMLEDDFTKTILLSVGIFGWWNIFMRRIPIKTFNSI